MAVKKIIDNIYLVNSSFHVSNQYIYAKKDLVLLIDTGIKGNTRNILYSIEQLGFNNDQIKYIFITHADGDHVGSLFELNDATKAMVCSSDIERKAIEKGESSRILKINDISKLIFRPLTAFFKSKPTKVDVILVPGQIFSEFDELRIIDSKGHTPGHLSFFLEKQRILFSGDSINISGSQLEPSSGLNCWDEEESRQSFEDQMKLKPDFICGGHGFWKRQ